LSYDIEQERKFSYKGISQDDMIAHLASFVSGIWQIHAFGEGNTRTTAVFTILYLRHIGFKVTNDMFAQHSWYFRNALVRANYKNAMKGVNYSPVYLERFFRNLLLDDQWDLRNRDLHISSGREGDGVVL
jgi:fido (protein-threonine AMPylation protein)